MWTLMTVYSSGWLARMSAKASIDRVWYSPRPAGCGAAPPASPAEPQATSRISARAVTATTPDFLGITILSLPRLTSNLKQPVQDNLVYPDQDEQRPGEAPNPDVGRLAALQNRPCVDRMGGQQRPEAQHRQRGADGEDARKQHPTRRGNRQRDRQAEEQREQRRAEGEGKGDAQEIRRDDPLPLANTLFDPGRQAPAGRLVKAQHAEHDQADQDQQRAEQAARDHHDRDHGLADLVELQAEQDDQAADEQIDGDLAEIGRA